MTDEEYITELVKLEKSEKLRLRKRMFSDKTLF
jgi:hypothetical protein